MTHSRQIRAGYTNFGGIRTPLPGYIVMEDRDDGTEWYLSHNAARTRFAINDAAPNPKEPVRRYGPYAGPYIARYPKIKLLIRGGRLGYEVEELPPWLRDRDNGLVASRRLFDQWYAKVHMPEDTTWRNGLGLAWTGVEL